MARALATAAYRLGASTVTTLMMVPAVVRGEDAGGPAPCRLADCRGGGYRVRELAALARDRACEDAVHSYGLF
jgi:hypothetical protein